MTERPQGRAKDCPRFALGRIYRVAHKSCTEGEVGQQDTIVRLRESCLHPGKRLGAKKRLSLERSSAGQHGVKLCQATRRSDCAESREARAARLRRVHRGDA